MKWLEQFDERQRKEIEFALLYANQFAHGTDGHNAKIIIARMAAMLDKIHYALAPIGAGGEFAEKAKREIAEVMGFFQEESEKQE